MLKRMMKAAMAMGVAALVAAGPTAHAQKDPAGADDAVVQKLAHGEINWSKQTVTATGSGAANLKDGNVAQARLMAERAAKIDAVRNIIETIQGIQVSGSRNANDIMSNGEVKTKIQGMAQGFKVVETKYYSDGSVDVVVQIDAPPSVAAALQRVANNGESAAAKLLAAAPQSLLSSATTTTSAIHLYV
jgi:hypothetical protein